MLWIRIGFNADPDSEPAFYINADPNPDPDPENFYIKTIRTSGNRSKNIGTYEGTKAFLKGKKLGLFVKFGQFRCS